MKSPLVALSLLLVVPMAMAQITVVQDFEAITGQPHLTDPNIGIFGPRFADSGTVTSPPSPELVAEGSQAMSVDLLNAGWGCIVRQTVTSTDWSGSSQFGVFARETTPGNGTTIEIGIEEGSGELWRSTATAASLTTAYQEYIWNLDNVDLSNIDNPIDGVVDLGNVITFDIIFRANTANSTAVVDLLRHGASVPVELSVFSTE